MTPRLRKFVYIEDCQHETGDLYDAKGLRYEKLLLRSGPGMAARVSLKLITEATNQIDASGGRNIIWVFAEPEAMEAVRHLFMLPGNEKLRVIQMRYLHWPDAHLWKNILGVMREVRPRRGTRCEVPVLMS
jgi:hypothetical protein